VSFHTPYVPLEDLDGFSPLKDRLRGNAGPQPEGIILPGIDAAFHGLARGKRQRNQCRCKTFHRITSNNAASSPRQKRDIVFSIDQTKPCVVP